MAELRRIALAGTGLIGGSIGLALRRRGFVVVGYDRDPARAARAEELGAVDGLASSLADAARSADAVVAVVSHVPQLAASTLMNVAAASGEEHAILLRLAAGGFRDMTRIASGHPGIWPDICLANRDAIVTALDDYVGALQRIRGVVAGGDRDALLDLLQRARAARRNLPVGLPPEELLVELRIPVPDRPGVHA